jgi:hypothetical protein
MVKPEMETGMGPTGLALFLLCLFYKINVWNIFFFFFFYVK